VALRFVLFIEQACYRVDDIEDRTGKSRGTHGDKRYVFGAFVGTTGMKRPLARPRRKM
jgi:hypothetical protein